MWLHGFVLVVWSAVMWPVQVVRRKLRWGTGLGDAISADPEENPEVSRVSRGEPGIDNSSKDKKSQKQ